MCSFLQEKFQLEDGIKAATNSQEREWIQWTLRKVDWKLRDYKSQLYDYEERVNQEGERLKQLEKEKNWCLNGSFYVGE